MQTKMACLNMGVRKQLFAIICISLVIAQILSVFYFELPCIHITSISLSNIPSQYFVLYIYRTYFSLKTESFSTRFLILLSSMR